MNRTEKRSELITTKWKKRKFQLFYIWASPYISCHQFSLLYVSTRSLLVGGSTYSLPVGGEKGGREDLLGSWPSPLLPSRPSPLSLHLPSPPISALPFSSSPQVSCYHRWSATWGVSSSLQVSCYHRWSATWGVFIHSATCFPLRPIKVVNKRTLLLE